MKINSYTLILDGTPHQIEIGPDTMQEILDPDPDDPRDEASRIFDALMSAVVDDPDAPQPAVTGISMLRYPFGVDSIG